MKTTDTDLLRDKPRDDTDTPKTKEWLLFISAIFSVLLLVTLSILGWKDAGGWGSFQGAAIGGFLLLPIWQATALAGFCMGLFAKRSKEDKIPWIRYTWKFASLILNLLILNELYWVVPNMGTVVHAHDTGVMIANSSVNHDSINVLAMKLRDFESEDSYRLLQARPLRWFVRQDARLQGERARVAVEWIEEIASCPAPRDQTPGNLNVLLRRMNLEIAQLHYQSNIGRKGMYSLGSVLVQDACEFLEHYENHSIYMRLQGGHPLSEVNRGRE